MRRLYVVLCVVLCAAVGTGVAVAATTTTKSSGKFQVRQLGTDKAGNAVFTGLLTNTKYGNGATVIRNKASGSTVAGTFKVFLDRGTISGTASNTLTVNQDGTATLSDGHLTITRGTGAFKGAKGSGTYSGSSDGNGIITANYKATIKRKH